jgi:hypothetical protein
VKSSSSKKRTLQYDDDESNEEQIENTPLAKRQSPSIDNQPSVIDDEELDFL